MKEYLNLVELAVGEIDRLNHLPNCTDKDGMMFALTVISWALDKIHEQEQDQQREIKKIVGQFGINQKDG